MPSAPPSSGTSSAARTAAHEVERLRPAADALPRSVEQVEPPPSLKRSLMEVVEREAPSATAPRAPAGARGRCGERLRELFGGSLRPVLVAGGAGRRAAGRARGRRSSGGDERRPHAWSPRERGALPSASARLEVQGDGSDGGDPRGPRDALAAGAGRSTRSGSQRDGMIEPEPTFEVGARRPRRRRGAGGPAPAPRRCMVTREPRGGSRAPSGKPLLTVSSASRS